MKHEQSDLADVVIEQARERGWQIASAESCTAGAIGQRLASAKGASKTYLGGVIAYTKTCKERVLGVPAELLHEPQGAVSQEVALAMASGVRRLTGAALGVASTGVAGPLPDEDHNPVGRVFIAVVGEGDLSEVRRFDFGAIGFEDILHRTIDAALMMLAHQFLRDSPVIALAPAAK